MLYFLQVLRGVAAVLVVFFHYRVFLNGIYAQKNLGDVLFSQGYMGVDIFFVISGFIMVYSTKKPEHANSIDFLIRRFFRLIPLAWLATLAFYFLEGAIYPRHTLFESLALIPLDNTNPPFFGYSLYDIEWTLSYEVYFYLLFGIALAITQRFRALFASTLVAGCIFAFQYLLTGRLTMSAHNAPLADFQSRWFPVQVFSLCANPISFDFVAGMFLGVAFEHFNESAKKMGPFFSRLMAFSFFSIFSYYYFSGYGGGHGLLGKGPGAICLVVSCLFAELSLPENVFRGGICFFLGAISYPLYLVHNGITDRLIRRVPFAYASLESQSGLPEFIAFCCLSVIVAACVHVFIEAPLQNLARRAVDLRRSAGQRNLIFSRLNRRQVFGIKIGVLTLGILIVGSMVVHARNVQSTNLPTDKDAIQLGMAAWNRGSVDTFERTADPAVSGQYVAHVTTSGVQEVDSKQITIEKGRRYRLDVWVDVKKGAVRTMILEAGSQRILAAAQQYATEGWMKLTITTEAPVACDSINVMLDDYHQRSDFYFKEPLLQPQ